MRLIEYLQQWPPALCFDFASQTGSKCESKRGCVGFAAQTPNSLQFYNLFHLNSGMGH